MATATYYYDSYDSGGSTFANPGNAIDNNLTTYASAAGVGEILVFNSTSCDGTNLGTITKVEARAYGYRSGTPEWYFECNSNFASLSLGTSAGWTSYADITSYRSWTWAVIAAGDEYLTDYGVGGSFYIAKVELRVTYTEGGGASGQPSLTLPRLLKSTTMQGRLVR